MNTLNNIVVGFGAMGTPVCLLLNLAGVIIGIVFVALPGLSSTMALVLFLPLTYSLKLYPAFALLLGLYIGSMSGSLISAILINIPSQPASIATTWDGAPMAKNGEAQKALGVAIVFSFLATILSIVVMMFIAPPLSKLALKFSAVEYFALGILSLTLVASLSGDNIFKGLTACLLGMAIGTIGLDPIDISKRYTFGIPQLKNGVSLISVAIGLFAFAKLLRGASNRRNLIITAKIDNKKKTRGFGFTIEEFKSQIGNFFRSSAIGVGIGISPGFGGAVSNIVAYGAAKKASKYPEKFGTGIIDGIVASESFNNASIGGAMVPLLTMEIPGDQVTMILLGAFSMKGLEAGLMLFRTEINPDIDISLKPADVQEKVMDAVSTKKIAKSLHVLPCGVQSMSLEIEGLVESSNTLAMIETAENQVSVLMTIPSAVTSRRYNILQQVYDLAELAGASVDTFADCPEWPYKTDSKLLATAQKAFYDKFGYEAGVEVSHLSLELGLFCKKISGLECISLGPKAYDVHTPAECLDWTTVQMVLDHIREILKDLND